MFKNLNAPAIGIREKPLPELVALAAETGFAGIDFDIREAAALAQARGEEGVRALFAEPGILPGLWSLPVAWKEERWRDDLPELARLAALGAALGCTRTATWVPSWSDEWEYRENWARHVERFRAIAEVLQDHGCRLGLEFLGPETLRSGHRYPFISTMREMLELAAEIGTGNVGLLLDAWHLYTSGESVDDLDRVHKKDVVTVHINDAPPGDISRLQDSVRLLPLESGVIDLLGFVGKLAKMRYDGPVTTEPFNERINRVAAESPKEAASQVSSAMDRLWEDAGLH